jgi:hypothetical protein
MKNLYKIEDELYIISNTENVNENCWIITNGKLVQVSYLLSDEVAKGNKVILTTNKLLIKDGVQQIDDTFLEWFVENPSCEEVGIEKENEDLIPYGNEYVNLSKIDSACIKSNFLPQNSKSIYPPKLVKCCKTNLIFKTKYRDDLYTGYYDCKPYKLKYQIILPKEEPKQDLEKEMFELEQQLDIPSSMRWHNSKPKQETTLEEAAENHSNQTIRDNSEKSFIEGANYQAERMYSEEEVKEILNEFMHNFYENSIRQDVVVKWFEQFKKK